VSAFDLSSSAIFERGQFLRRRVWLPLRRMTEIFHVLPWCAAILIFLLLATDGQIREHYLAYLEGLRLDRIWPTALSFVTAAFAFTLLSAGLYDAHYWLSTLRRNVAYSSVSNPEAGSKLRGLQRVGAFLLALVPWLGFIAGLFELQRFLVDRCVKLANAGVDPSDLIAMQQLPRAPAWLIALTAILFALAVARFLDRYQRHAGVQVAAVAVLPLAATGILLLLANANPLAFDAAQKTVGLVCFAAFSVLFWGGFYLLYVRRTGFIYSHRSRPNTGFDWRSRRRAALVLWQLVPWIAIAIYVVAIPDQTKLIASAPGTVCAPDLADLLHNPPGASRWSLIPVAMLAAMAIGLFVATELDRHREDGRLRAVVVCLVVPLMLTAVGASFHVDTIVGFYRWIGPLAAVTLGLLLLFAMFTLLAVLSQRSGFPALLLVVLIVVVSALFPVPILWTTTALAIVSIVVVVMAAMSRLWSIVGLGVILVLPAVISWTEERRFVRLPPLPSAAAPAVADRFKTWITQPQRSAARSKPYPVFIIAVEGGGIYAATAASLFLAKLQDANPDFAQHVFAISAVSGGAIGATIFQALAAAPAGAPPHKGVASASDGCAGRGGSVRMQGARHPLLPIVTGIMQDDHFSPVVGAIFPELVGMPAGRAEALAASFTHSVQSRHHPAAQQLGNCFVDHWSERDDVPALVLNSTWVETGSRVAFAPFALHGIDDSLYSFSDQHMPGNGNVNLMTAAMVSARFPLILPPYSLVMEESKTDTLRWNFVDGGYSDTSGAGTALALYRVIDSIAREHNARVGVILLTGSDPQPNLTPGQVKLTGTPFRDTLAPIAAVMKVRDGLGNQAVARVCYEFYSSQDCRTAARAPDAPLKIVEIEDELYSLALGWKISRTTFEVISWMVGNPELVSDESCRKLAKQPTALRNSCVLRSVTSQLASKQ